MAERGVTPLGTEGEARPASPPAPRPTSAAGQVRPKSEPAVADPEEEERPSTPEDTACAICLEAFNNKSYTNSCFHQFCFLCLKEWSKIKAECPLCKQRFQTIIHTVRSHTEYEQYHVVQNTPLSETSRILSSILPDSEFLTNHPVLTSAFLRMIDRSFTFGEERERERERRGEERGLGIGGIGGLGPASTGVPLFLMHRAARRAAGGSSGSSATGGSSGLANRRRMYFPDNRITLSGASRRRNVYRHNRWVRPHPYESRVRESSPEFYRNNPAAVHRLVPWLTRELHVLLDISVDPQTILSEILDAIVVHPIRSSYMRNLLQPALGSRVDHFIHEFYHFATSPHDMNVYDVMAGYDMVWQELGFTPPPQLAGDGQRYQGQPAPPYFPMPGRHYLPLGIAPGGHQHSSSRQHSSDDDSDVEVVLVAPGEVNRTNNFGEVFDPELPGPSRAGSQQQAGGNQGPSQARPTCRNNRPSPSVPPGAPIIEIPDTDSDSDVEIIHVKPPTPIVITVNSSDSETEVTEMKQEPPPLEAVAGCSSGTVTGTGEGRERRKAIYTSSSSSSPSTSPVNLSVRSGGGTKGQRSPSSAASSPTSTPSSPTSAPTSSPTSPSTSASSTHSTPLTADFRNFRQDLIDGLMQTQKLNKTKEPDGDEGRERSRRTGRRKRSGSGSSSQRSSRSGTSTSGSPTDARCRSPASSPSPPHIPTSASSSTPSPVSRRSVRERRRTCRRDGSGEERDSRSRSGQSHSSAEDAGQRFRPRLWLNPLGYYDYGSASSAVSTSTLTSDDSDSDWRKSSSKSKTKKRKSRKSVNHKKKPKKSSKRANSSEDDFSSDWSRNRLKSVVKRVKCNPNEPSTSASGRSSYH